MQRRGARTRQKAGTALNYASSRSHAVFTIILETAEAAREQHNAVRTPARGPTHRLMGCKRCSPCACKGKIDKLSSACGHVQPQLIVDTPS